MHVTNFFKKNLSLIIILVVLPLLLFVVNRNQVLANCSDAECSLVDSFQGDVCLTESLTCFEICGPEPCDATGFEADCYDMTYTGFCPDDSSCGWTACSNCKKTVIYDCSDGGGGGGGSPTPTPSGGGGGCNGTLTITPTSRTFNVGQNVNYLGTYTPAGGGPESVNCGTWWSSDNTSVAYYESGNCNTSLPPAERTQAMFTGWSPGSTKARLSYNNCVATADMIVSASSPSPTPTPSGVPNDSQCINITAPASVTTNQTFAASVTMKNTGTSIWKDASQDPVNFYGLTNWPWPPPSPGFSAVWNVLPQPTVAPNAQATFNFNATAPNTVGTYAFGWRMVQQNVAWFGQTCSQNINVTTPPTLQVVLAANPASGPSPLDTTLTADIGGTATGTINYNYWWNCTNPSNSVATVEAACGVLPSPAAGACASNANGHKCLAVTDDPKSTDVRTYTATSTAKVIAERGAATPAEARTPVTITNSPPSVPTVTITTPDYCVSGPSAFVSWTYSDPEGNPQSAYQVQADDTGSSWNPPLMVDTGKVNGSGTSYYTGNGVPPWNWQVTYKARVKVWDSLNIESAWKDSGSWSTPKHAYPLVNFTWVPFLNPSANQPIQFTDQTVFYDTSGVGQRAWNWLFGDGGNSTTQNPPHTYINNGTYNITETVTDKDGYSCALTKPINIERPIPVWKEVSPK